jgi:hypothetical protein
VLKIAKVSDPVYLWVLKFFFHKSSDYRPVHSIATKISEKLIRQDVEGSGCHLIWDSSHIFLERLGKVYWKPHSRQTVSGFEHGNFRIQSRSANQSTTKLRVVRYMHLVWLSESHKGRFLSVCDYYRLLSTVKDYRLVWMCEWLNHTMIDSYRFAAITGYSQ